MRASSAVHLTLAVVLFSACERSPTAPSVIVSACERTLTAPSLQDVLQERTQWSAHRLTRYAYLYELTGFFINFAGHPIRVVVLADTVRSAEDMTTGDTLTASTFPTLDGLYDQAMAALSAGTLTAIAIDSTFSYPCRMDLAGPPDASGSILASGLELLPS